MLQRLFYGWRVFATGMAFSLFGLGGPIMALGVTVALVFVPMTATAKCRVARKAIRASFNLYIGFMKLCGLLTFEVRGQENFPTGGQLVVANHPSLLDVVFLMSVVRGASCIVKEGLFKNIFTRPPITAAKFICNSSSDLIDQSKASLAKGDSIVVFPEGTRSLPGKPFKFQRGVANIALSAGCDIVPVIIECRPSTLMKHQKWYDIPAQPPHFLIHFQPVYSVAPYLKVEEPQCKVARQLTRDLESYFSERTAGGADALLSIEC